MAVLGGEQSTLALKAVYCTLTLQLHCTPSMVTVLIAVLIIEHAGRPFYPVYPNPWVSLHTIVSCPAENYLQKIGLVTLGSILGLSTYNGVIWPCPIKLQHIQLLGWPTSTQVLVRMLIDENKPHRGENVHIWPAPATFKGVQCYQTDFP